MSAISMPIIGRINQGVPWARTPLIDRFEAKYIPEPNSGCWIWFGSINQYGYGRMLIDGRMALAHRFSYQTFKGPLAPELVLDHLCRMRCCVNPDHLDQVKQKINVRRSPRYLSLVCKSGHPWNEENTWLNPRNGWRQCRACNLANQYRMKEKNK